MREICFGAQELLINLACFQDDVFISLSVYSPRQSTPLTTRFFELQSGRRVLVAVWLSVCSSIDLFDMGQQQAEGLTARSAAIFLRHTSGCQRALIAARAS